MFEIITGWLVFAGVIGGVGLPVVSGLRLRADERCCLGAAAGCIVTYLWGWFIFVADLPREMFLALPASAAVALLWRRRAVTALCRESEASSLLGLWVILAGWCLGLLALVRSYSGGEWVGDWLEHYHRTLFFLDRLPLSTRFLNVYALPARPPLANVVVGALMALTQPSFACFQVFMCLFGTLTLLPAALFARRFARGRAHDPAAVLAILLMLSPLFVENVTFAWTKLPAALFVLTAVYFYFDAETGRGAQAPWLWVAGGLAAAVITHYSAVPYAIALAAVWTWRSLRGRVVVPPWRTLVTPLWAGTLLLASWVTWSIAHFGRATFDAAGSDPSIAGQLSRRAFNLFHLIVPHPLRPADLGVIAQESAAGWWRDYFFNLYQTNLPLAFGTGGLPVLLFLFYRYRRGAGEFWVAFVAAVLLLNLAIISWSDRWGVAHIGLQPLVVIGLAWLAAEWPGLGPRLRACFATGLAFDFGMGIGLHFAVQHVAMMPITVGDSPAAAMVQHWGYARWTNFSAKSAFHLTFLGDLVAPASAVIGVLVLLLALAFLRARAAGRSWRISLQSTQESIVRWCLWLERALQNRTLFRGLVAALVMAAATWLWLCWCVVPWLSWNEVRLEPSFLLAHGLPVYPAGGSGPITTWMYGPTTVLLLLPAVLASNAASALLVAGAINLTVTIGAIVCVCGWNPVTPGRQLLASDRVVAALVCVFAWPVNSLQYIQADNAAIALGLLANLLLARGRGQPATLRWFAALATVGAVAAKQTAIGLLAAQLVWLYWSHGPRSLWSYASQVAVVASVAACAMIIGFTWEGLWLNLVQVPGGIPWSDHFASRLGEHWPLLIVHLAIPLIVLVLARRRVWIRGASISLAGFSWVAALPLSLASLLKTGGASNSLHGLLYLLPVVVLCWLERPATGRPTLRPKLCAIAAVVIAATRLALFPPNVWRPVTGHLRQMDNILAQLPGEVWLPWHPLVTYYREHRFDHVEDGLHVRRLAGRPVSAAELRAHLPPAWHAVGVLRTGADWGLARALCPAGRQKTEIGLWTLYSWTPPPAPRSSAGASPGL